MCESMSRLLRELFSEMREETSQSTVHQRIAELIDAYEGGNKSAFARRIELSTGALADLIGGRLNKPSYDVLLRILAAYPLVKTDWLLKGSGLREQEAAPSTMAVVRGESSPAEALHPEPRVVSLEEADIVAAPVVNFNVAANYQTGYNSQEQAEQLDVMSFPKFMVRGSTHTVFPVLGDSMSPIFLNKDYVWCRFIPASDWRYFSQSKGKVCVLMSRSNGLQIKRVFMEGPQCLRCESENRQTNPAFTLDFKEIEQIWEVQWRITNNFESLTDPLGDKVNMLDDRLSSVEAILRANNML